METFTLWHHVSDPATRELAFYATAVNVQGIARGTEDMIATMLADMGLLQVKVERWTVSRFATDYVSDDRDSPEWQDVWMDTWAIQVHTGRPVRFAQPAGPGFVGTAAWDETWKGPGGPPDTCTVIADFGRFRAVEVALGVFARLGRAEDGDAFVADVHRRLQRVPEAALRALWERQAEEGPLAASACREHRQLHVSMPARAAFFEGGARLARAVEDVARALGGTTQWRDRAQ